MTKNLDAAESATKKLDETYRGYFAEDDCENAWKCLLDDVYKAISEASDSSLDAYAERHQAEKGFPPLIIGREYLIGDKTWVLGEGNYLNNYVFMRTMGDLRLFSKRKIELTWKKETP